MLIGLTKSFWDKYNTLVAELQDLGITTIEDAKEAGLDSANLARLRMAKSVTENNMLNLWNPQARFNQGLPF
jgi:hypothetical protein